MKLKKGDIVEIIWLDSHTPADTVWMTKEDHLEWAKDNECEVCSVGYYVSEDKTYIHLVADMTEIGILRPFNIAKGCIKKTTILKKNKCIQKEN